MTKTLRELEIEHILDSVDTFFNDPEKSMLWFCKPNLLLGGLSPSDMISKGRYKKLRDFVDTSLDENQNYLDVDWRVAMGLKDAMAGRVKYIGSFSKYIDLD